jgi:acetyl-CoA carboxylase alpha subunit
LQWAILPAPRGQSATPRAGGIVTITFVRTATIAPGKVAEALAFAHQIAKLVEKITGLKVGVSMPIAGNRIA